MPKIDIGDCRDILPGDGRRRTGDAGAWARRRRQFLARPDPALEDDFRVISHDHRGCGAQHPVPDRVLGRPDGRGCGSPAGCARHRTRPLGGPFDRRSDGQIMAQDYPDRLGSLVLSATWAGTRRVISGAHSPPRKAVLGTLGMAEYARHSLLSLHPPWYIARNEKLMTEQEKFVAGANQPVEIMGEPDRRDPRFSIVAVPPRGHRRSDAGDRGGGRHGHRPRYPVGRDRGGRARRGKGDSATGGHFVPHILVDEYNAAVGDFLRRNRMG